MQQGKAESRTINVAVPRDLANRLKVVASLRDISMQEALDKFLRPIIDREYRKCVEQADAALQAEG